MLQPERLEAVSPDRALCLPTFSHFLIVNKTPLSLCYNRGCNRCREVNVQAKDSYSCTKET